MKTIDKLKSAWTFPEVKPDVPKEYKGGKPDGWCKPSCVRNLKQLLTPEMKLVVDGGSWKGLSAYLMMEYAPNATIVCIDNWTGDPIIAKLNSDDLPTLYETFCVNMWDVRDRIVPVRQDSLAGLKTLKEFQIVPDLIYVDWEHSADSVERDVSLALDLFPDSIICGDDWNWQAVRDGLDRVCDAKGIELLHTDEIFWQIQ